MSKTVVQSGKVRVEIDEKGNVTVDGAEQVDVRHGYLEHGMALIRVGVTDKDEPNRQALVYRVSIPTPYRMLAEVVGVQEPWSPTRRPQLVTMLDNNAKAIDVTAFQGAGAHDHPPQPCHMGTTRLEQFVEQRIREQPTTKETKT